MFNKLLTKYAIWQVILIIVLLAISFSIVNIHEYEQLNEKVSTSLDSAEQRQLFPYFMGDVPSPGKMQTKGFASTAGILYSEVASDTKYTLSDKDFCSTLACEAIVKASQSEDSGKLQVDDKWYAYRKKVATDTNNVYLIYVCDFTEEYELYRNGCILIGMLGLIISGILVLVVLFFNYHNFKPIQNGFERHKQLVANASHELKTPLTILTTQMSIIESFNDELPEECKQWVDGMQEQVDRMSHLVNEMLELAKVEAVRDMANYKFFDFSEMVNHIVLASEALAFENEVITDSKIQDGLYVFADPDGMEKVVYTLIENAVKYTPKQGKIIVSLYLRKRSVILSIKNTGVGIPRAELPKLFDRFYRGDKAHTSTNNFGLGLAIAKALVDASKGTICVDSDGSSYTEFIVALRQKSNTKKLSKKERTK